MLVTMNPEIKQKWIEALESGQYKQGSFRLRVMDLITEIEGELPITEDKYCVLGVLCDLAVKAGVAEWEPNYTAGHYLCNSNQGKLPEPVQKWSGLSHFNSRAISGMNDTGIPFTELAEYLRNTEI